MSSYSGDGWYGLNVVNVAVPEGDTRIQAGVQRSETPVQRSFHQNLNPEGVIE